MAGDVRTGGGLRVEVRRSVWAGEARFVRACEWLESLSEESRAALLAALGDGDLGEDAIRRLVVSLGGEAAWWPLLCVRPWAGAAERGA